MTLYEPSAIKFSVIIPTHNRCHLLPRAVNSAIAAIQPSDEIIVVDDGSTDDTKAVLHQINCPQLRYLKINNGGSAGITRNTGLEAACNDYVAWLDDDDEWFADKLTIQRKIFSRHPEVIAVFSNFSTTYRDGKNVHPSGLFKWGQPIQDWDQLLATKHQLVAENKGQQDIHYYIGEHYTNQLLDDYILPSSLVVNYRKLDKTRARFATDMYRNESWLYSSGISRFGPVAYVDKDLLIQHGDAVIRRTDISPYDTIRSRITVLEREWGTNPSFLADHRHQYHGRLKQEVIGLIKSNIYEDRPLKVLDIAKHYSSLGFPINMMKWVPDWFYIPVRYGLWATKALKRKFKVSKRGVRAA